MAFRPAIPLLISIHKTKRRGFSTAKTGTCNLLRFESSKTFPHIAFCPFLSPLRPRATFPLLLRLSVSPQTRSKVGLVFGGLSGGRGAGRPTSEREKRRCWPLSFSSTVSRPTPKRPQQRPRERGRQFERPIATLGVVNSCLHRSITQMIPRTSLFFESLTSDFDTEPKKLKEKSSTELFCSVGKCSTLYREGLEGYLIFLAVIHPYLRQ